MDERTDRLPGTREAFRETCVQRDDGQCVVPWCDRPVTVDPDGPGEVHHIIERSLWDDGGYFEGNGACVCNDHHLAAEANEIPPQALWQWIGIMDPLVPIDLTDIGQGLESAPPLDKWGEQFDLPPHTDLREYVKYPSTGHLPFSPEWDDSRVDFRDVFWLVDTPLVVTIKQDGSNACLVRDVDEPVRARNGSHAEHPSFDLLKQLYWEQDVYGALPEHLQVFGEWLYAKHSIHYGCGCDPPCEDVGPALGDRPDGRELPTALGDDMARLIRPQSDPVAPDDGSGQGTPSPTPTDSGGTPDGLRAYFQVFAVYDTRYHLFLSWDETVAWADRLGFPTVPVVPEATNVSIAERYEFYDVIPPIAERVVRDGHEGIVVRPRYPIHYGQITDRLGKYVRDGHVDPEADHWSHREIVPNLIEGSSDR